MQSCQEQGLIRQLDALLHLSPDHHPDIFVLMCSGSGCAVQMEGGYWKQKYFFLLCVRRLMELCWCLVTIWFLSRKKGGEMKELKMKGCRWRLKTWWFGLFGVGAVGIQLWLPFPLITGTTSTRTRTTHVCLSVRVVWMVTACLGRQLITTLEKNNSSPQRKSSFLCFCFVLICYRHVLFKISDFTVFLFPNDILDKLS